MRRVQRGDAEAFAALFDRHAAAVHGLARRILRDPVAAEDVTQETFIGFWRSRAAYAADRGEARGWLLAIARNRAIDVTRRRAHRDEPLDMAHEQREAPECTEAEVMRRGDVALIDDALRALPAGQRDVIELAYLVGLTQIEIAERLQLPLGTVKSRARLALKRLGAELSVDFAIPAAA